MKSLLRRFIHRAAAVVAHEVMHSPLERTSSATRVALQGLYSQYRTAKINGLVLPPVDECGFRILSQTEEDGILLRILGEIGMCTKLFVELGCGDGLENNTANLQLNFGWHGLMIDANQASIHTAEAFWSRAWFGTTWLHKPVIRCARVTKDNVNEIILQSGIRGEIDLLSIDIDSNDYWIWETIDCIAPRVVVIEANVSFGDRSLVTPYSESPTSAQHPLYYGASLSALTSLGRRKGYSLVAVNRLGFNGFFVKSDYVTPSLPEVSLPSPQKHPYALGLEAQFQQFQHLPFVVVSDADGVRETD